MRARSHADVTKIRAHFEPAPAQAAYEINGVRIA